MRLQEIQIRHLRSFAATARLLNFRKAADFLNITQPALSRQIQQLEASLGFELFERSTKSVRLRASGQVLLESVEQIIENIEVAATRAKLAANGKMGCLRVGLADLSLFSFIAETIYGFRTQYPDYEVEMVESPSSDLIKDLILGNLDCAFTPGKNSYSELNCRLVFRDAVYVVINKSNSLSAKDSVSPRDLVGQPLILFPRERNPDFYDQFLHFIPHPFKQPILLASTRLMSIMMAATDAGISFVGESMAHLCPKSVKCVKLTNCSFSYDLYTVWKKGRSNPLDPFLPTDPEPVD